MGAHREIARTLNMDRRQLDREQRREVVAHLWREGHSGRAIAEALGSSKSSVYRDVEQLSHAGQLERGNRVTGTDGKSYPAVRTHLTRPQDARKGRPERMPETAPKWRETALRGRVQCFPGLALDLYGPH